MSTDIRERIIDTMIVLGIMATITIAVYVINNNNWGSKKNKPISGSFVFIGKPVNNTYGGFISVSNNGVSIQFSRIILPDEDAIKLRDALNEKYPER